MSNKIQDLPISVLRLFVWGSWKLSAPLTAREAKNPAAKEHGTQQGRRNHAKPGPLKDDWPRASNAQKKGRGERREASRHSVFRPHRAIAKRAQCHSSAPASDLLSAEGDDRHAQPLGAPEVWAGLRT